MKNKKHAASSISTNGALQGFKDKLSISATADLEEVADKKSASDEVALLSLGTRKDGGPQVVTEKKDLEIKGQNASVDLSKYMTGGGYTVDTSKLAGRKGYY